MAGDGARVVSLSSRGHFLSPIRFEDLGAGRPGFDPDAYDKWSAYGQAKTANVLFAVELDRRLAAQGVRAFAVHPGVIATELARHLDMADIEALQARSSGGELRFKSTEAGAATSCYAATAPELDGMGARYLEDCALSEVDDSPDAVVGVRSHAVDPDAAARLWAVSEEMVGETFDL